MNGQNNIKDLIEKFREGRLSPLEAKELAMLAKKGDQTEGFKSLLDDIWQKSSDIEIETPSDSMLNRLIGDIEKEVDLPAASGGKSVRLSLNSYFKYAAIILLTMGITWFAKEYLDKKNKATVNSNNLVNNEITVSYGSKSKVTLPDGSTVNLNSGSTLRYPAHFDKESRNVYIEGEAFFDVKKDPKHPFYVKTNSITIKVLGTRFNVKSYSDEKTVQTTLVSGTIEIYSNKKSLKEKDRLVVLKPNQQAICEIKKEEVVVSGSQPEPEKKEMEPIKSISVNPKVDVIPVISWKDNRMVFRDEKFADLSQKLERWYNVEIEIKDENLRQALFSGIFVKETIEQALNALELATPFHYQMEKNHIVIYK